MRTGWPARPRKVRQALGYREINIYGVSYGVTMGLAYRQRFSGNVRTAVLDSGSLLSVPEEQQAVTVTATMFTGFLDTERTRCWSLFPASGTGR